MSDTIERMEALLSRGYFPQELPLAFTTESFGRNAAEILRLWSKEKIFSRSAANKLPGKKNKRDSYNYSIRDADLDVKSKPKRGFERRNIHIVHPIPQLLLSYEMAKNWNCIQKWLAKQSFSLDRIEISENYPRSIRGINFDIHRAKKGYIESSADWLVKTDISRFYPTIYTHSITWAAYEKERVKKNLKLYQGSFADRIDALVRACNRNQTIGIPIGPETSRVIAEIISSSIDRDLQRELPKLKTEAIDRLQDDWTLGLETLEAAEHALSRISRVYRNYGLEINGSKTPIERAVAFSRGHWASEIGSFVSHKRGILTGARLRELLSLSLRLQSEYMTESVIGYVIAIVEGQPIFTRDVVALESFLMKAAVLSPISMNGICRLLLNIQHFTKKVSVRRIGERFTYLAERFCEQGHLYEVIWILYLLRGLKVGLKSKSLVSMLKDNVCPAACLILLDMQSKGLCNLQLPKDAWVDPVDKDRVRSDPSWLLLYEGFRHGWLTDKNNLMSEPFFRAMASKDITFYDEKRNVEFINKVVKKKRN